MRRSLLTLLTVAVLAVPAWTQADAQTYTSEPVKVSTEKVRKGGKVYYSHVVGERQTLYSIAKAYGVSMDEIQDANPEIKEKGLQKGAIILIPVNSSSKGTSASKETSASKGTSSVKETSSSKDKDSQSSYFIHKVQWYEDLDDIARKYNVSADDIIKLNGLKNRKVKARMKLKIPRESAATETNKPGKTDRQSSEKEAAAEEKAAEEEEVKEPEKKGSAHVTLILPFNASGTANGNTLDFYAGVLLAARDLGNEGVNVDLSVFDASGGNPVTSVRIGMSDLVIGPVSTSGIDKVINLDLAKTPIVSPLDPKAATLAQDHNFVIQAPSSNEAQYRDIISWVREDKRGGDKVLVITERGGKASQATSEFNSVIASSGLDYTPFSYSIFEGRTAGGAIAARLTKEGTNRIIINSDSEAFANDLLRNLNLLVHQKYNIVIYCPAKIRSFDTVDIEDFHNLNMHVSCSYYADYDDKRVMDFLMDYRALFNSEPSQFSFQGYDVAKFFIGAVASYGKNWMSDINGKKPVKMLQSTYEMSGDGVKGLVNIGIRRVVYGPDYSVTLEK
jgi:LysM repeat protein